MARLFVIVDSPSLGRPESERIMSDSGDVSKLLRGEAQLGPYPMEKLARVDKPTTEIVGEIDDGDRICLGLKGIRAGACCQSGQQENRGDSGAKTHCFHGDRFLMF